MATTLEFDGAAGTVTGSRFLLDHGTTRVLVDCGMFQGLKALRLRNWMPPSFDPKSVAAVVLTHAHLDHSGYIPRLVRLGYRGPVYCTPATLDVTRIVLLDAAEIQEDDAERANRRHYTRHEPALPLFDRRDAERAIAQLRPVPFGATLRLGPGIDARFHRSGHILGSAFIEVLCRQPAGPPHRIVFSGDLGRSRMPLHPDPEPLRACDTLVLESTYGDRDHDRRPLVQQLADAVRPTLQTRGIVLIPAFAVARAQLITWLLRRAMDAGRVPRVPLHLDSPMASEVTDVYGKYLATPELDPDTAPADARALFPREVHVHRTVEQSKSLNGLPGPRIIIASSGMLTGGRVLHHLARLAPDPANLLLLTGFQAAGTRGRALLEHQMSVRIHGFDVPLRCQFAHVDGLSAHADAEELVRWATTPAPPANVFLVHGEGEALTALAARLQGPHTATHVPRLGQRFALTEHTQQWREAPAREHPPEPGQQRRAPGIGRRPH